MSGSQNIHASLVLVGSHGILIRGDARSGKSSLALSLLRAGARENVHVALVSDDRVDLRLDAGFVYGTAPSALGGLIEISGVGIVRLTTICDEAPVTLVADLEDGPERLPEPSLAVVLGRPVPRVVLPARQASLGADILLTLLFSVDRG